MAIIRKIVLTEKENKKKEKVTIVRKGTIPEAKVTRKRKAKPKDPKTLVIVESPAKAKTIEKFLGNEYRVMASRGHLRDLPKNQLGVVIEEKFRPKYINLYDKKELIEELLDARDEAKDVLLATDPDREGEAISWHLAHLLDIRPRKKCRIMFHEITEKAVTAAVESPQQIDIKKVNAQQARRVLDRIVGYKLSPLLWKKLFKGLSAGRVQSVAVLLICEREEEIKAFIPEEYWTIESRYKTSDGTVLETELALKNNEKIEIRNEEEAAKIVSDLQQAEAKVDKIQTRRQKRRPQAPFTTSTMQQDGVNKLNFGAKKIMMLAQQLYEGLELGEYGHVGLITYMRTDSTRISEDMIGEVRRYIGEQYGEEYVPEKPNVYGTKQTSQDAHEAIRPTNLNFSPKEAAPYLTKDQLRLYTLIWNRFVASQMNPAEMETLSILVNSGEYTLKATGTKTIFKGFLEVYEESADAAAKKAPELPHMEEGTILKNVQADSLQHFTQPPPRYTEATLIKTLEEQGIGRPSTYAPTLDTIQKRNYVQKENKKFIPTELGSVIVDLLKEYFPRIINVSFTAQLETELDEIEAGEITYYQVLKHFYNVFENELKVAEEEIEKIKIDDEVSDEICEVCGAPMVYKLSRYGRFLACSNFPECRNTKTIVESTGIICPKCKSGTLVKRKSSKGRVFYGCDRYPDCDFLVWNTPTNEVCPKCGSMMVEKKKRSGETTLICSNADCVKKKEKKEEKKEEKHE